MYHPGNVFLFERATLSRFLCNFQTKRKKCFSHSSSYTEKEGCFFNAKLGFARVAKRCFAKTKGCASASASIRKRQTDICFLVVHKAKKMFFAL